MSKRLRLKDRENLETAIITTTCVRSIKVVVIVVFFYLILNFKKISKNIQ